MAAPPPPNKGPPGTTGPQGQPQRDGGGQWPQQIPPLIHHGQLQSFVVPPGAQTTFAPVLPPNMMILPRSPAMVTSNRPAMMPPNHPFMTAPVLPPEHFHRGFSSMQQQQAYQQQLLRLTPQQRAQFHRYAQARRLQHQALAQPNPPSQQQQHQFASSQNFQFTQQPNLQMNQPSGLGPVHPNTHFNLPPSVGHPMPTFHPVNVGQSASNPPLNYPVNQGRSVPPHANQSAFEAFARQIVHNMNTQSAEEFIHGRGLQAPILIPNRPIYQHTQQEAPLRPISQPPFPQQQYSPKISRPSSPILYHPQPRPTSFQRASPGTSFTPCPATPSQHRRRRSSKGSNLGMDMGDCSTSAGTMGPADSPLEQEIAGDNEDCSSATLADIDPSNQAADVVDGFVISDDSEDGWGNTNVDDIFGVLDGYLNIEEHAKEFAFPQAATQQFSADQVRKSVPFMKATIYLNIVEADLRASAGPDQATGPRKVWMSHSNRQMRWHEYAAQYKQDVALDVNQFRMFPDKVPPKSDEFFHLYPNPGRDFIRDFHKDTAAIDRIPTAGQPSQYLPSLINTELWYDSIVNLQENVDLWLPMPLLHMMSHFYDTPYCIATWDGFEIKMATLPGRPCEFTEPEATTLMTFTMERYRAGIDNELARDWKLYRDIFRVKYKWAPTVERMQVLDLMLQVDFVYFLQGLGKPLHPWSKYYQNKMRTEYGLPECPMNDGP